MDEKILKDRIERFFSAELTVEEEQVLCSYLRDNDVPTELRKDKEAIIALCTLPEEVDLPEGAAERLEAMLDGLEEMRGSLEDIQPMRQQRIPRSFTTLRMTRLLLRAACVVGVVMVLFLALPESKDDPALAEMYEEEDTFDTPEEAMQCLMAAYDDVMFAMNTARDNTREAHQVLTQSVKTSLNMLKFEPTKK
ncbi:MAG: hypothetical protein IKY64_03075 [Bacteroidaceae bacterium]|nr:hypothetical protein [Bacteroidaceae bacterium]